MTLKEPEKKLLTLIGEDSSLSQFQLQSQLYYKRVSTVSGKIKALRKAEYIKGPFYHINLNAVGENRIYTILTEIRFDPTQYTFVLELIKCIDCWEYIFPTIQGDTFFVLFRSNYYAYLTRILSCIQDAGLIDYRAFSSQNRWFVYNPDFSGGIFPSVEDVFEDITLDLVYPPRTHDVHWRFLDLKVMQYLQVRTCNIAEIQRMEKREYGRFWRRNKIKYSIQKIINANIAERKHYNIFPYPWSTCYAFLLLVEGSTDDVTKFAVNFGKGCRLYKAFTICRNIGFIWCVTSPQVGPQLMNMLGSLSPRVEIRCLQLKSVHDPLKQSFNEEHFDFEQQRWTFPFTRYKEQIKILMEKRKR
jgi:hypothetical protein